MVAVREEFDRDFEAAYRAHAPILHRRSRKLLPAGEAEDAVQETFLRAWARHGTAEPPLPWLLTVLRNLAIDRSRAKRAEPVGNSFDLDRRESSAEDQVVVLEERRAVRRAIETLTPPQRLALQLREWHGKTHSEIAAEMGTTVPAVESLLLRGRRRLRRLLDGALGALLWPSVLWKRFRHIPNGDSAVIAAPAAASAWAAAAVNLAAAAALAVGTIGGTGVGRTGDLPRPQDRPGVVSLIDRPHPGLSGGWGAWSHPGGGGRAFFEGAVPVLSSNDGAHKTRVPKRGEGSSEDERCDCPVNVPEEIEDVIDALPDLPPLHTRNS